MTTGRINQVATPGPEATGSKPRRPRLSLEVPFGTPGPRGTPHFDSPRPPSRREPTGSGLDAGTTRGDFDLSAATARIGRHGHGRTGCPERPAVRRTGHRVPSLCRSYVVYLPN